MSMNTAHAGSTSTRHGKIVPALLAANAALLGVLLVNQALPAARPALDFGATALAGPPEETDLNARVSAAEQRKEMIAELRAMNQRLSAIEGRFKGALPVKVVEMPREGNARPAPVPSPSK